MNSEEPGALYAVAPDGTHVQRLTPDTIDAVWGPSWSPDGRRLVFGHRVCPEPSAECRSVLSILEADGAITELTTFTEGVSHVWPDWSPDGSRIAFGEIVATQAGYVQRLAVINADGTDLTEIEIGASEFASSPDWSPDSSQITFGKLYVVNADGTHLRAMLEPYSANNAAWSPDGRRIAFARADQIWLMAPDGSDARPLTSGDRRWDPVWSPDGRRLAFWYPDGSWLGVMNVDGSSEHRLEIQTTDFDWGAATGS